MAIDHHHSLPDRQTVYEDLVATLQAVHGGVHAPQLARELFQHATNGTELVALVDGGGRAICYSANARVLSSIPLDRGGLDLGGASQPWGRLSDPATWVDATDNEDLAWVHPRYRWVLESGRSSWWHTIIVDL